MHCQVLSRPLCPPSKSMKLVAYSRQCGYISNLHLPDADPDERVRTRSTTMMNYASINTGCIDVESLPWIPFAPYSPEVLIKYIKLDPVRGQMISFLTAPGDMQMPRHHHTGTDIVYTISGQWKDIERDWVATPGSVV